MSGATSSVLAPMYLGIVTAFHHDSAMLCLTGPTNRVAWKRLHGLSTWVWRQRFRFLCSHMARPLRCGKRCRSGVLCKMLKATCRPRSYVGGAPDRRSNRHQNGEKHDEKARLRKWLINPSVGGLACVGRLSCSCVWLFWVRCLWLSLIRLFQHKELS